MYNLLLTDEEIRKAKKKAYREGQRYSDDGEPIPEKEVAIAQHNKILQELKRIAEAKHRLQTLASLELLIKRMEKE